MYRVDITADLNDEDHTGYLWTLLDEARDPAQIRPGAIVVAGDEDTAAVCQVVDLVPSGDSTIVHLKLLPGLVEDYVVDAVNERADAQLNAQVPSGLRRCCQWSTQGDWVTGNAASACAADWFGFLVAGALV